MRRVGTRALLAGVIGLLLLASFGQRRSEQSAVIGH
jgi:hypothetical protein